MKRWLQWLIQPAVLGSLGVLILSALTWWVGPLLAFGSYRPLQGVWARCLWIVLMWALWIGNFAWQRIRQRRANALLLQGMSSDTSADREGEVLKQRFDAALSKLKSSGKGLSWLKPAASLYELPWYVFVGAPGSGKTTALQNAGLHFLLSEGAAASPVKGIGGTRNCDWWFTSEAVLIDTAGRYATQESDAGVDSKAWQNFLNLLRKSRPRQPINGVLLTINIQDLLQQNVTEQKQHAQKLRDRLSELQSRLGVRPPIYVMVTKADLIAGFQETFESFSKAQRDQVWGFSFDAAMEASKAVGVFDTEFDELEKSINSGLFERMQAERDPAKRASIFSFPMALADVQPVLRDFLAMVFAKGGPLQEDPRWRGVYFTSGTQEGAPIDRVLGALSRSFGLQGRVPSAQGQRGKSFFLQGLLQNLIFTEQHLVAFNAAHEARRKLIRLCGLVAVGLMTASLLVGWGVSYVRNKSYAQEVANRVPALRQLVDAVPPAQSSDLVPVVGVLTSVRQAATVEQYPVDSPPLLNSLGLYQGDKLDAAAQIAHQRLLEHALWPRLGRRLEERLRASNKDNLEQAYEALKSYLMLFTPDKFDASALKPWIAVDLDSTYHDALSPQQQKDLSDHVDALLAMGAPANAAPMDKALVQSVRDMLTSYPVEYRIYSRLKRQYHADLPDFSVARAGGPNSAQVFGRASGEPLSKGISGFYTKDGYQKTFQASVQTMALKLAAEESWVLGTRADVTLSDVAGNALGQRVRRLYLTDYIAVWDKYLADVQLIKASGLAASMNVAQVLASPDSPLTAYMRAAAKETTLVPAAGAALPAAIGQLADQANKAKEDMAKLVGAQPVADASANGPIERMVDDHFASLNRLVQGAPAPIDEVQKMFGDVFAQLQAVDAAQKSKTPPPAGGGDRLKAAAGLQPEPIRSMLNTLVDTGTNGSRDSTREVLNGEIKPITDFCNRAITNRYPFASGSKADVLPDDFGQLFGTGGMLDEFFQRQLLSLVDTGTNPWSYKPLSTGVKPPTAAALADFQRAAKIRDGFFRSGGKTPGFKIEIRAAEMGDGLKELALDVDGQVLKFVAGNTTSVVLNWPSQKVSSQIAVSTIPATTPLNFEGPWALFRLFDRFEVQPTAQPEKFSVNMNFDGKRVRLDVIANSVVNPFRMREMQQFRCPGSL
jgi:type VI secretion system protein ImpL